MSSSVLLPPSARQLRAAWLFLLAVLLVSAGLLLRGTEHDAKLLFALNGMALQFAQLGSALSVLGLGAAVLLLAGAVGINRPRLPALVLVLVVCGGLAVQALKLMFSSPRPIAVLAPELLLVVGTALKARSMPSGHAAMLASVAGSAWLAAPWAGTHRGLAAVIGLSVLALLGALARVVVVAHWPSDVLVGAGVGLVMAALCAGWSPGRRLVDGLALGLAGRVGSRLMAALMVVLAAMLWVSERDYPLADAWYVGLAIVGLLAALGWWSRHPLPWPARTRLLARLRRMLAGGGMRRREGVLNPAALRRLAWCLLGLALPMLLVMVLLRSPEAAAAWHRLAQVGGWLGLFTACGWSLSYLMRACRLRAEWSARRPQALLECLHVTLAHNLALGLLPMRAGELGYPVLLRSRWGVGLADAGASLVLMRLQDTVVLAWLCMIAAPLLLLHGRVGMPQAAVWSGGLLVASAVGLWRWRVSARRLDRAAPMAADVPGARSRWRQWLEPAYQAWARASLLTWAFSLGNWLVKLSTVTGVLVLLLDLPWRAGWVGAVAGELAGALPMQAPAGFGTYEAAVVLGVRLLHEVSAPAVLGAALVAHLLALCSACALFGLLWLWRSTLGRRPPSLEL